MIYFIQSEAGGPIKIGCSKNPDYRLSELQTGSPVKLILLGIMNGDEVKEKELHDTFSNERMAGEWFAPSDQLISFLLSICHRTPIRQDVCPTSLYINEVEVAKITGMAVQTLRNWRHFCKGPVYYKVSRSIRYKVSDVLSFMEKNRIEQGAV